MRRNGWSRGGWSSLGAAALLLAAGCAAGPEEGDAAAPVPGAEGPAAASGLAPDPSRGTDDTAGADTGRAGWTAGIVDRRRPEVRMTVLEEIRSARNDGYDRVVFRFSDNVLPGYHLEYVDRPVRQCGSGKAVEVAGDGWLAVRLEPAQAHDERGRATVRERERALDLPVLRELQSTCDFEGQVEWVLGVASPNRFRVLELSDPARLVVDVRH